MTQPSEIRIGEKRHHRLRANASSEHKDVRQGDTFSIDPPNSTVYRLTDSSNVFERGEISEISGGDTLRVRFNIRRGRYVVQIEKKTKDKTTPIKVDLIVGECPLRPPFPPG